MERDKELYERQIKVVDITWKDSMLNPWLFSTFFY